MASKNLLGIAVAAATLAIAGCNTSSTDGSERVDLTPIEAGAPGSIPNSFAPIFSAGNSDVPLNTDLLFGDLDAAIANGDGTALTADTTPPVTTAINNLPGFSQTAAFDLEFNQPVDPATVIAGQSVFLIELKNRQDDENIDALSFTSIQAAVGDGIPFELPNGSGRSKGPIAQVDYDVEVIQTNNNTEYYIRIVPLKPLNPRTKYIVAMTNDIKSLDGRTAQKSAEFETLLSNDGLPSVRLVPVRQVAKATTAIASGYISQLKGEVTTVDDIILTTSFTTNGGLLGLKSIANPTYFLRETYTQQQAQEFLGSTAVGDALYTELAAELDLNDVFDIPQPRPVTFLDPALVDAEINSGRSRGLGSGGALEPASPITIQLSDTLEGLAGSTLQVTATGASPAYFVPGQGDVFTRYIQGVIELPNYLAPVATRGSLPADILDEEFKVDFSVGDTLGPFATGVAQEDFVAGSFPKGDVDIDALNGQVLVESNVTYRFPFPVKQPVADTRERAVAADNTTHYAPFMLTVPARVNYQALATATGFNPADPTETVPLGFSPIAKDCTNITEHEAAPLVILVHGITTNRATSVGLGAILAANCVATLAIDLPLHGIAPTNASPILDQFAIEQLVDSLQLDPNTPVIVGDSPYVRALAGAVLDPTVLDATNPLALVAERHDNIQQLADGTRVPMVFAAREIDRVGTSGSAFINFKQLTRSRDNIRQAVVDLLNLSASVENIEAQLATFEPTAATTLSLDDIPVIGPIASLIGFDLNSGAIPLMPLDANTVSVAGHSLGAYVATAFAAVNNDSGVSSATVVDVVSEQSQNGSFVNQHLTKFTSLILGNGGSQIAKSLENSPSLAPRVVAGLAAAGVDQGTSNFERFLYITQSALDEVDPAVAAADIIQQEADTDILLFNMIGGGPIPNDRTGISLPPYVGSETTNFLPDDTVPNFDYFGQPNNPFADFIGIIAQSTGANLTSFVPTAKGPMVGTDGLAEIIGAEKYNVGTTYSSLPGAPLRIETRFKKGTHSTFANADVFDAFAEIGVQVANFVDDNADFTGQAPGDVAPETVE